MSNRHPTELILGTLKKTVYGIFCGTIFGALSALFPFGVVGLAFGAIYGMTMALIFIPLVFYLLDGRSFYRPVTFAVLRSISYSFVISWYMIFLSGNDRLWLSVTLIGSGVVFFLKLLSELKVSDGSSGGWLRRLDLGLLKIYLVFCFVIFILQLTHLMPGDLFNYH